MVVDELIVIHECRNASIIRKDAILRPKSIT
jgi:hypothetical protein